jgi:hypothetical protein
MNMSDNTNNVTTSNGGDDYDNLLSQVKGELNKSRKEAVKNKLKEKVKALEDAQRVVAGIELEIEKLISDARKGLV